MHNPAPRRSGVPPPPSEALAPTRLFSRCLPSRGRLPLAKSERASVGDTEALSGCQYGVPNSHAGVEQRGTVKGERLQIAKSVARFSPVGGPSAEQGGNDLQVCRYSANRSRTGPSRPANQTERTGSYFGLPRLAVCSGGKYPRSRR
jgi:hypothetical protein